MKESEVFKIGNTDYIALLEKVDHLNKNIFAGTNITAKLDGDMNHGFILIIVKNPS